MKIGQRGYISLFFPLSEFATSRGLFTDGGSSMDASKDHFLSQHLPGRERAE